MFDTGLWLFVGLVILFIWRGICWWKCCGTFLRYFNYISLLLALVFVIIVYDCVEFYLAYFGKGTFDAWDKTPGWLKFMVYVSPGVVWASFCLSSWQVYEHFTCIREEVAVVRHDRAVQIIILPVVYGTMCLSCMTKCYQFLATDESAANEGLPLAVAKAETCLWIGDLYESWALYQFGVLSLEVMETSLRRQSYSENVEERSAANALIVAHTAVTRLAWLGILSFVLVSVADSAVAVWYLTIGAGSPDLVAKFNNAENQFNVAGFLASCAAIFNVYVVESQFHSYLEDFHPYLKFITVKILVTFAYGQLYIFECLQWVKELAPQSIQNAIDAIPVLGSLVNFNEAEFYLFYSTLLMFECLMIGIMHIWAWRAGEVWYEEEEKSFSRETKTLMPGQPGQALLYGSSTA